VELLRSKFNRSTLKSSFMSTENGLGVSRLLIYIWLLSLKFMSLKSTNEKLVCKVDIDKISTGT